MTDFAPTDAERMVKQLAHDFALKEIRPVAKEYDEREEFPWDLMKKAAALGLTGRPITGAGAPDGITQMLIAEEMGWGCGGVALSIMVNTLNATFINLIGTPEQRARWMPQALSHDGEVRLCAMAITEPDAGSDAGNVQASAIRDGDEYVLNGPKRFISNGGIADVTVVFAREDPGRSFKGVSAFIVPKGMPGFTQTHVWKKLGLRASVTADLALDDVRVPLDHRLGPPDPGYRSGGKGALGSLSGTRAYIGAMALGIGRAAFEYAADYARDRQSMGVSIVRHQGVGFQLADMDIALDAARFLCWRAGWLLSNNQPFTVAEGSKAKTFATDTAMKCTVDAIQVVGSMGYMRDNPLEKWLRDVKIWQIFDGTNEIQRLVISRNIEQRRF